MFYWIKKSKMNWNKKKLLNILSVFIIQWKMFCTIKKLMMSFYWKGISFIWFPFRFIELWEIFAGNSYFLDMKNVDVGDPENRIKNFHSIVEIREKVSCFFLVSFRLQFPIWQNWNLCIGDGRNVRYLMWSK